MAEELIPINSFVFRFQRPLKADWLPLLLVFLLSSGAWLPLLHPGFLSTRAGGDSPFLLIRLDQLVRNLRAGVFPVRWMPDAAYGLGYPFFNYYAALPYYLAAGLVLWGWGPIAALKITQAIGFLASGAAMYILGRCVFQRRASALLAAVAYVYAPFHLVNVYMRGDSLSEFYAFVWYPLLGWALLRLRERASAGNVLLLGAAYGGLILTHNISALIATPVVIAYALLLLSDGDFGVNRRKFLLAGLAGGLLGLGLSSWFWLSAFLERDLVQLQEMTTGYFHFAGHFRGADLIQRHWLFDYTTGGDHTPFCMGLIQALLSGLGSLALIGGWVKRRRIAPHPFGYRQGAFALFLLLFTTWCITPLSRLLWEHLPLLELAQFPWRFLSLQAVFAALLTGCLAEGLALPSPACAPVPARTCAGTGDWVQADRAQWTGKRRADWWVALLLSGMMMAAALGNLRPEWMAIGEGDVTPDRLRLYEYFTSNIGTTVRWEYLPRWVETRPFTSAVFLNHGRKPPPMALEGEMSEAHLLDSGPTWEMWNIAVTSPEARLAFHTHYFPGWRATVDGSPHPLSPVEGWGTIGLSLPRGRHRVVLRLGRTPLRWAGELISLLALIAAAVLLVLCVCRRRWAFRVGLGAALFILGGVSLRLVPTQTTSTQDLSMDFIRQPYLHHNPEGVRFEDAARLLCYTLSSGPLDSPPGQADPLEVQAGETMTVTLSWEVTPVPERVQVADRPLTATVRLVSAAEPLFHESPIQESVLPLESGLTRHRLRVPLETVSGPYLLAVELRDSEGRLAPLTSQGKKLGTTYLRPIWVKAMERQLPAQEPLAHFGERIALLSARAEERGKRLRVHLTWQALRPVPANYNLSLRLKDPSGRRISVRDLQPHHGFYPTSLWPPEVAVEDFLSLPIPEGIPPGSDYTLEIILYPVSTLIPIGQVEVRVKL
ncbi:MAG: 6-pyruvoyl-tetrahydropterin synthase-related protein [Chloroflexota bacterium]|nr:6-pyruvoyl-tetrahydropterin synthase-related protein [Chloroflexota bacterium]